MRDNSKAMPARITVSEFLSVVEGSGVVPILKVREVRDRLRDGRDAGDATGLARRMIKEGMLTSFQARRLLKGKRGLVFGRYILLDQIGQGARGRVFQARHSLMDRVVALKVILPDANLNARAVSRFFREMKIVGRMDHPNVVRALDADEHEGRPYIVMEFLEGDDLERVFARRGPLAPAEVIDTMAQAARGLAHAHEQGVIHRDIKPTNLFLTRSGVVKVLDLGLGDLVGAAGPSGDGFDTDEGVVVGTTDFMPPELVRGQAVDARGDLFSLGCTMYRLLTGAYAFPGLTREDRLVKRIHERPVPIREVRPDIPGPLARIVDRLLAERPEDRFGSAADLADALEPLMSGPAPRGRRANARSGRGPSEDVEPALHTEQEAPLDWTLIESALYESPRKSRPAAPLEDRPVPQLPTGKALASHRQSLEEDGLESGREAHEQYRNELVQMNKVMSELRAMDPKDEPDEEQPTWLERLGEKVGDSLEEPGAGLIITAVVSVVLLLALALAVAVG